MSMEEQCKKSLIYEYDSTDSELDSSPKYSHMASKISNSASSSEYSNNRPQPLPLPLHSLQLFSGSNTERNNSLNLSETDSDRSSDLKSSPSSSSSTSSSSLSTTLSVITSSSSDISSKDLLNDSRLRLTRANLDPPLHAAVRSYNYELIKSLVASGIDIDEPNYNLQTALHIAVENEFIPAIEILVEYGANVLANDCIKPNDKRIFIPRNSTPSRNHTTPIHLAAKINAPDIVEILLTKEINVSALRKNFDTVFKYAVMRKNFKVINCLIGNSYLDVYHNAMHQAMKNIPMNHLAEMKYSEGEKALLFGQYSLINSIDPCGRTLLMIAVENQSIEMIKYLLACNADVNLLSERKTPLYVAIWEQNRQIIDILLNTGRCDLNVESLDGETALQAAAKLDDLEMVEVLLKKNAEFRVEGNGYSPYHAAVTSGSLKVTEYFLDILKVDINSETASGRNALLEAVAEGKMEMVEFLLDRGIDINSYTSKCSHRTGHTALHTAVIKRSLTAIGMVELLLSRGADIEILTIRGTTLLYEAARERNERAVKSLLAYGADVNKLHSINFYGQNSSAALKRHVVKLLAARLHVCKKFRKSKHTESTFYDKCRREVKRMMRKKIGKSSATYYDLLKKNVHQVAMLAKNEDIVKNVYGESMEKMFPLYNKMIICHLRKGESRNQLIERVSKKYKSWFLQLPYTCVRQILMYFDDEELSQCLEKSV